ncbi:MAG TPA: hypothetical protein VK121_02525 [Pseudogracilibacillus sp.]|nr:hypothetical protein [Pseudogracilibacillus sp.]
MSLERIRFEQSDFYNEHLDIEARKIARFLYNSSQYILERFLELMRWIKKYDGYQNILQRWLSYLIPKRKNATQDLLDLEAHCYNFFKACQNKEDFLKMRGLVPEKLFEIIFDKRHQGKHCHKDYGVKVIVDNHPVLYRPKESEQFECSNDSNGPRQTVDGGFWDGKLGEFVEIKLQPEGFHTKEINYLKLLAETLKSKNLNHRIYFISLGNKEIIKNKLERSGVSLTSEHEQFILIDKKDLLEMEEAS